MTATDRLAEILELVEQSLDEPGTDGDALARRAHLSRFHFDRLAAAALGEPPGRFRRRVLLERAAHQLSTGSVAVIDIAFDAGYEAPEAFTRAFVRAYGCSPSQFRRLPNAAAGLPAPSGIHFHPPGALRLPATEGRTTMDVLLRMLDHHLWLTGEIVDRLAGVEPEVLDRPIELSVEGIDADPTLRSVVTRLVSQLEMWLAVFDHATEIEYPSDNSPAGLRARLDRVGPAFRTLMEQIFAEGRAAETFIDATCEPPQTFSYAGVLAHVLTFSAVRRTLAIGALETAGVDDLGAGDPMTFVGGHGSDAGRISRKMN
ncbi:helix-turn-helix transcriptional regulator [Microlunatus elymi]|uniref:Helix-turn-helix transcriptional regulator n=1 Tax=Microlunatus elymi TaxID=2596828 RepID=A0A516Q2Z9_9ACTN|nr:AraC family transcriptional regulator [Microlunatus elymi]QDP97799.1 helix-turn-helix transcriptional regulator [Microlunatus elymi]